MGLFDNKELRSRDKLFNSLVKNSDTVYLMYDNKSRSITYMTKNLSDVLHFDSSDDDSSLLVQEKKEDIDIIKEIFELPILKEEIRTWDGVTDFVSSMISYRSSTYQHTRWLKIKIYPLVDKKNDYAIVLISDATREHDEQHLLVLQAGDIKAREKQLNQITAASYDMEIDINLVTKESSLRNLKSEVAYFGENRIGSYPITLSEIIDKYISESDRESVSHDLSIENLIALSESKTLDPISVRYHLNNDDENIWLESTAFFTVSRGETHVIILTKNVTENAEYMRRQNIMLQNALTDAKKANEAKTSFLEIMSHEIRTPLNAIMGLSESILGEDLSRTVREDVESISSASNSLLSIIDRILDISKVESGSLELEEKEYNVPKMLKSFENITKEHIGNKPITLTLNVDESMPTKLYGDEARIQQVMLNILDNAVKFTDKGSITIDAKCEKASSMAKLIMSVTDTGCGIEKEKLETLFDSSSDTESLKYVSGVGLSIAKRLIDLLKGEIEVESVVSKGSTFTVSISQQIMDETKIGDINGHISTSKKQIGFSAKGCKVLVVDDNKLNLKVATRLLKPYEVEVDVIDSGDGCIEKIKNGNSYDIILLDQMMPNKSGVETLHSLKEIAGFKTPVIVLTADAIKGKKEEYLSLGFNDYLSKPINVEELSKTLKKYLKKENEI